MARNTHDQAEPVDGRRRGFLGMLAAAPVAAVMPPAAAVGAGGVAAAGAAAAGVGVTAAEVLRIGSLREVLRYPDDIGDFAKDLGKILTGEMDPERLIQRGVRLLGLDKSDLGSVTAADMANPLFDLIGAKEMAEEADDFTLDDLERLEELAKNNDYFESWLEEKNEALGEIKSLFEQLGISDRDQPLLEIIQNQADKVLDAVTKALSDLKRSNPAQYKKILKDVGYSLEDVLKKRLEKGIAETQPQLKEIAADVETQIEVRQKEKATRPLWGGVWEVKSREPEQRIFHIKQGYDLTKAIKQLKEGLRLPKEAIKLGKGDLKDFLIVTTPMTGVAAEVLGHMALASKEPMPPHAKITTPAEYQQGLRLPEQADGASLG